MRILSMVAVFKKDREIKSVCVEEFKKTISNATLYYYKHSDNFRSAIQKIREKWANDLFEVELANKRRRLEELEKIYEKCMTSNQIKNALGALYQIQGEVEKEMQNIGSQTNYQINIYKDMTETELEEERLKSFERLKQLKGELPNLVKENQENKGDKDV